jgi:flagellar basal body-associated protein FliL
VKNRTEKQQGNAEEGKNETGRSTESGIGSEKIDSKSIFIMDMVIMGVLLMGMDVAMIFFSLQQKTHAKRIEEEKRTKQENLLKDGGVEMIEKHFVWSPDVIGGPVGE